MTLRDKGVTFKENKRKKRNFRKAENDKGEIPNEIKHQCGVKSHTF